MFASPPVEEQAFAPDEVDEGGQIGEEHERLPERRALGEFRDFEWQKQAPIPANQPAAMNSTLQSRVPPLFGEITIFSISPSTR